MNYQNKDKTLSFFEFWPTWLFYFPIYAYVICLMVRYRSIMLLTAVNPRLAGGQFVGESKDEILQMVRKYLPEYSVNHFLVKNNCDLEGKLLNEIEHLMVQHKIDYPFVAKPDLGCRGAGVNLISNQTELMKYLNSFPIGQAIICQELIPYEPEVGVFYCKLPNQPQGKIISLTLKFFPIVVGDGISNLKDLVEKDPRASQLTQIYLPRFQDKLTTIPKAAEYVKLVFAGNHSKGAIFKDGRHKITPALEETFEHLAQKLPEFYFGRFDIRYESFEKLEQGKCFKIVEINGVSAESTHIWDSDCTLFKAWNDLFKQFRLAFIIAKHNTKRGVPTQNFKDFYKSYLLDKQLSRLYPKTH